MARKPKPDNPFRWFDSSPEVIQLVVVLYVRYPLSLRNVEDLAFERGIDICHEAVRTWANRFGPMFAARIRKRRVHAMRQHTQWRWHLNEVYVRVQGEMRCLWRAVDHEGEVLDRLSRPALIATGERCASVPGISVNARRLRSSSRRPAGAGHSGKDSRR